MGPPPHKGSKAKISPLSLTFMSNKLSHAQPLDEDHQELVRMAYTDDAANKRAATGPSFSTR